MSTKNVVKPIFVMYYRVPSNIHDPIKAYYDVRKYLEDTLIGYNVIIIPIYDSVSTHSEVFYPSEFKEEKIENFVEEVAKKTAFKNIRIKFEKE